MNKLSYIVEKNKIKKIGLNLNYSIEKNIKDTLDLFKNLKYK